MTPITYQDAFCNLLRSFRNYEKNPNEKHPEQKKMVVMGARQINIGNILHRYSSACDKCLVCLALGTMHTDWIQNKRNIYHKQMNNGVFVHIILSCMYPQEMRRKVEEMQRQLLERKNKLRATEDTAEKKGNVVDKVNKILNMKVREG